MGTLWIQENFRKKSRTVPKKIQRGDPLGTSGCVCILEKVKKMKGGPLGLSLQVCPGLDLALVGFRIASKKWTDQCEDCSLKKQDENV